MSNFEHLRRASFGLKKREDVEGVEDVHRFLKTNVGFARFGFRPVMTTPSVTNLMDVLQSSRTIFENSKKLAYVGRSEPRQPISRPLNGSSMFARGIAFVDLAGHDSWARRR